MSRTSKRVVAIGIGALSAGLIALWAQPTSSFASEPLFAQANDPQVKPNNDAGNDAGKPNNQAPGNPAPSSAPASQPSTTIMQNSPQSGVPARCASITNTSERQKCMDTPKGQ